VGCLARMTAVDGLVLLDRVVLLSSCVYAQLTIDLKKRSNKNLKTLKNVKNVTKIKKTSVKVIKNVTSS